MLSSGLSRYDKALTAAERASADPDELGLATWSLAELIEAAARTGALERASGALRRFSESTSAAATDWALGIQARSTAPLSGDFRAERLYLEAIERLGRTRIRAELARAHLLYGEWLRRQGRRRDAREQLRTAYQMLDAMGRTFHPNEPWCVLTPCATPGWATALAGSRPGRRPGQGRAGGGS